MFDEYTVMVMEELIFPNITTIFSVEDFKVRTTAKLGNKIIHLKS